jgi:hypothetical protein
MVDVGEICIEYFGDTANPDQVNKGPVNLPDIGKAEDADDAGDEDAERKNYGYGITPVH